MKGGINLAESFFITRCRQYTRYPAHYPSQLQATLKSRSPKPIAQKRVADSVNGEQVAELLEIFLFDDSAMFAGDDHAVVLFLIEVIEDFADFEVGNGAFLDWVDLYTFHKNHSGN